MQYRSLGSSSLLVSTIGLGTVKLGRTEGIKYPNLFTIPTDAEAKLLIAVAKDLGVNVLDTAPSYGNSEERLGQLLHPNERKDWILMTKVGEEFEAGQSHYDFTPEHTIFSVERSLQRLNTDYLDVVLVHSDGNDVYNIQHFGILECLNHLKQKGLIRAVGMSSKTIEGGILALDHSDVVMATYNPIYTDEKPVILHATEQNKGIFIKKALASGHLNKLNHPDPIRYSLEFILQEPGVSSIIIGTLNPKHLEEAVT